MLYYQKNGEMQMSLPVAISVYDELVAFLVEKATPQQILAFKPSEAAQRRALDLTEKNKADSLSAEERVELDQMLEFDLFVTLLKAKALASL